MRRSLLAVTTVLALAATACAADDPDDAGDAQDADDAGTAATSETGAQEVEVRPFSEIQDSPVSFEVDPLDPSAGIFRVTTTEPAICAIVWGETDEFGRFNNSLAMDGTGIEQHDVGLPDLEPGREYVYVLQGTTADGTLYRSEVETFTIPETDAADAEGDASPQPDLGENLATDADIAEVSSEFGERFAAELAIDGDLSTEWSSRDDGDEAFVTLDLGTPTDLTGVAFLTRSMADGSAVTETYTVTVDDDEVLGPFPAGSPAIAEVAATGQRLRFAVEHSTGGNVGAVEIQVFGG